ncbi:MAG: NOL1/NOP2/sun family putative RNA methylase [Ignavibacteriaceae bacterium]|nr:NOL1/NOP2/sun family putative RNA methylase [Ignavibacteriaceae bacterium]
MSRRRSRVSEKVYSYLVSTFGDEAAKTYWDFVGHKTSKYIRVNELKISRDELTKQLEDTYGITTEELTFPTNALKIKSGFDYAGSTLEIAFGFYYMQGLTSMLPAMVLNPKPNDIVLDLCSAPGSKTTQIAELMKNKGILIANEIEIDRIKALVFNMDKMNFFNYGVVNLKGEILSKYYNSYFDKILVDAPCSGLGIIQKKNEVNKWWSLERVGHLAEIQTRLIVAAIKMLKVGGELVYSTCTLTPEENEVVINKLVEKYPLDILPIEIPLKSHEGFKEYQGVKLDSRLSNSVRIYPWEVDSDGFFVVKLKKIDNTVPPEQLKWKKHFVMTMNKSEDKELAEKIEVVCNHFGIDKTVFNDYKFLIKRKDIFFTSKEWDDKNLGLFQRVGTKFGLIDKRGEIVLHSHAATIFQDSIKKYIYDLPTLDELRTYLMGGLIINNELPPGQYAVKFNGYVLGTGVVIQGGLKSRFPRSKRTQKIRIKGLTIK